MKHFPFLRWLLCFSCAGLVACASHEPKPPKTTDYFVTVIQADGTKQFGYSLVMQMPERGQRRGGGPGGPGGRKGPPPGGPGGPGMGGGPKAEKDNPMAEELQRLTTEGLLATLEDTGFCRNGYTPLDKQVRRNAISIQGQCQEKATDVDREKFPNPEPKKVVEERLD